MKTLEEAVKILKDFKELMNELDTSIKANEQVVNEADKAFGDLRHYCEFHYPTKRSDKTKVVQLMNYYSVRRREAKDTINALSPLMKVKLAYRPAFENLNRAINEANKEFQKTLGERKYAPRVLDNLFKGE